MKTTEISTFDASQSAYGKAVFATICGVPRALHPLGTELSLIHQCPSRHPQIRQSNQRARAGPFIFPEQACS